MAKDNPKLVQALKDGKAPLEYLVYSVLEGDAHVHKGGADKYGVRNWLRDKIKASTYEGAILRHFKAWAEGEDVDPESGYSHLYHIRACCAILLDSGIHDTLIDDRNRCESHDCDEVQSEMNAFGKTDWFLQAITGAPHRPTMKEIIDLESIPSAVSVAISEYKQCGVLKPEHKAVVAFCRDGRTTIEGPFSTVEGARDWARRNPNNCAGFRSVHTI